MIFVTHNYPACVLLMPRGTSSPLPHIFFSKNVEALIVKPCPSWPSFPSWITSPNWSQGAAVVCWLSTSNSIQTHCSPANWPVFQSSLASRVVNKWHKLFRLAPIHMQMQVDMCTGESIEMCLFAVVLSTSEYLSVVISSSLALNAFLTINMQVCLVCALVHLLSLYPYNSTPAVSDTNW